MYPLASASARTVPSGFLVPRKFDEPVQAYARQGRDGDALTPQEWRVAEAVRRGASNRAIAAELFLSPKTVEFHLHQIYRKLGVHSRTQLIAALADRQETAVFRGG